MFKPLICLLGIVLSAAIIFTACSNNNTSTNNATIMTPLIDSNTTAETPTNNKLIIYQIMMRLFGNCDTSNMHYGTIEQNGCGKFDDINQQALHELRNMGFSHMWYTGILEHATMTNYANEGIKPDDADVVKGRAGSPYAIKDYYDVNPDLANNVKNRLAECEALFKRTHDAGLKVIIDFVPNHVARSYASDAKPADVIDLGQNDNNNVAFSANNNFYYIINQKFIVPPQYNPLQNERAPGEDQMYEEYPAKVTGNNVFNPAPSVNDWFETVKLNYGVDIQNDSATYFSPIPDTWLKMRDILLYWASKGVDGFRCDMAQMVPVPFWNYVITEVKQKFPHVTFIAEIYTPSEYKLYIEQGKFDFLYDKVGMYDAVRRLIENKGNVQDITYCWSKESAGIGKNMLRFLENHDEQRLASSQFAGSADNGFGGMVLTATIGCGPLLIYFGQEHGEQAHGSEGFQGDDGRTTIFDYWGVPAHQAWMNNHKYDGGLLSPEQREVRKFYLTLLKLCNNSEAIANGYFYELQQANTHTYTSDKIYSYIRYSNHEAILFVINFSDKAYNGNVKISHEIFDHLSLKLNTKYKDMLNDKEYYQHEGMFNLQIAPKQAAVIKIK